MFVVLASRYDEAARNLVARWAAHGASLLTCEDLSVAGWCHYRKATKRDTAVISGQVVGVEQISGVLTLLSGVIEQEITQIIPADRAYVAEEMNAFLISWLSGLKCPVLNRPTPTCLAGSNWRKEQWVYTAAQIGIPVRAVHRRATLLAQDELGVPDLHPVTVTVIGDRCIGAVDDVLASQARQLATTAEVDLLCVHFSSAESGAEFIGADLWPDVTSPDVADAILEYLSGGVRC